MKPRLSSDPRTEPFPAAAIAAWAKALGPTIIHPNSKRLLEWKPGSFWLLLLVLILASAWLHLFPPRLADPKPAPKPWTPADVGAIPDSQHGQQPYPGAIPDPTPNPPVQVRRASPVDKPAPRAQPVPLAVGAQGFGHLPDGRWITVTNKGLVPSFGDLPKYPALGDQYTVTEGGAREGVSWIWYTPLGWNHPAWIDP